jgi:hypothetical protein
MKPPKLPAFKEELKQSQGPLRGELRLKKVMSNNVPYWVHKKDDSTYVAYEASKDDPTFIGQFKNFWNPETGLSNATKRGTDLLTWNIKKYTPVFEEEMPAIESLSIQEPKTNIDDIFDEVMPTGSGKLLGRGKSWNDAGKMYNEILCMRWRT